MKKENNFDFELCRERMFATQIRTCSVQNEMVFSILRTVNRADFVLECDRDQVFFDCELPLLKTGFVMFSPQVEARLLQTFCDHQYQSILVVGSGSGYFAALLSHLFQTVFCLEQNEDLVLFSKDNLSRARIKNVSVTCANAFDFDFSNHAFDAIFVAGSVPFCPEIFLSLFPKCLVFFRGTFPMTPAVLLSRGSTDSVWEQRTLFDSFAAPLIQKQQFYF